MNRACGVALSCLALGCSQGTDRVSDGEIPPANAGPVVPQSIRQAQLVAAQAMPAVPWSQEAQLTGYPDSAHVGQSVALSGDTALLGGDGEAYVFTRNQNDGDAWTIEQRLQPSDAPVASFGFSVAVDGDTALVGAPGGTAGMGAVYVFVREAGTWVEQRIFEGTLTASNLFGMSVAMFGNTAAIGAPQETPTGAPQGAVYFLTRTGQTWEQQQRVTATGGATTDYLGRSVARIFDTAVVGAPPGVAYVFDLEGDTWNQSQTLVGSDTLDTDVFGIATAIDGDTAVVGAYLDGDNGVESGSAYVFVRAGGTWSEQTKLLASDGAAGENLGYSVAVSGDRVLLGSRNAAYLFVRTGDTWSEEVKLMATNGAATDNFGWAVAIQGDTSLVGAPQDDQRGTNSGAAFVFDTRCVDDEDCETETYCAADYTCQPTKAIGDTCDASGGADCREPGCRVCVGSCVEGVCCDCPVDSICGFDGTCNAQGECNYVPAGTQCAEDECNLIGTAFLQRACDGEGACVSHAVYCELYTCSTVLDRCWTSCGNDSECLGDNVCNLTTHECESAASAGRRSGGGGGCSLDPARSSRFPWYALVLVALPLLRRRRAQ